MEIAFMKMAIAQAKRAYSKGEAPIGAVIVHNKNPRRFWNIFFQKTSKESGKVIAKAHNLRETKKNALFHAEILAIARACKRLGVWRLSDCDIYVTLEPCPMCAGALVQARIDNVYFGAYDPKSGSVGSVINLLDNPSFNHHPNYEGGIMKEECGQLLSEFFRGLRQK